MSKRKPETKIKGTDISVELATVLDAFPFYVMLIDEDHRIIFANKSVSNDLGVEPQSVIGGYCPRVVHGLDEPFPGCPLEEAVGRGHAAVTRQLYDARFGRWVESEVYPLGRRTAEGCEIYLHMTRDITIEKKAEEEARRGYDVQEVLNSILRLSLEDTSIDELLRRVLDLLLSIPWLSVESRGAIFLAEDDSGVLLMKAQRGLSKSLQESCARLPFGKCLCGRAALTQETQFADCLDDRHEVTYAGIAEHGHYCVPVLFAGKTLGVINLYIRQAHERDCREEDFLTAVANTLAGIVKRRHAEEATERSYEKLRLALDETVGALASTAEARDPYTAGHQQRVAQLSCAIARELGLSDEQVEGIRVAGILHDIGKMYVPAEFLSKPGRLTAVEFSVVKEHSKAGYDILKTIEFKWPVGDFVLQHHERLDGSGYPSGLRGDDILLEARILAVADVVEAMAHHRPYRPAVGLGHALEEISQKSGLLYDSNVAQACLSLFYEKGFKFE